MAEDKFFEDSDKGLPDISEESLSELWPSKDKNPEMKIIDVPKGLSIDEALRLGNDADNKHESD